MQKTFHQGFRLTNDGEGLLIEATDYHATPLYLDLSALAEVGLGLRNDLAYPVANRDGLVESFVVTLEYVMNLVASQEKPAKWKRHLENLAKLQLLIGGLEPDRGVERLDEEG